MSANVNSTIMAVPCDQPIVLNNKQAEKILGEINKKRSSKMDKDKLEQDVKVLFTKPNRK